MDNVRSTVVGVFQRRDQAQCAVDGLRQAGFPKDQVNLETQRGRSGELRDRLIAMGVPEDEARFCEDALQSGSVIVAARTGGRYDDAFRIIQDCGSRMMQPGRKGTASPGEQVPGEIGQLGSKKDLNKWKRELESDDPGAGMDPDLSADTWADAGDIAKNA